jgi:hypothetical protein
MRETCARVLAAALLTGAIATVVGMSTLVGAPSQPGAPLAAPPSTLERSVRLTPLPRPTQHVSAPRLVTGHTIVRPRPVAVARRLVVVRPHDVRPPSPRRELAAAKPAPALPPVVAPAAAPDPAPPAQPAVAPEAEAQSDEDRGERGKEHGHGRGQEEQDE